MSSIIVDGVVQDAIVEYGIILDAINKTSSTQEISKLIQSVSSASDDDDELIKFLNDKSLDIVLELNEKDMEPVFNLYLYLLNNLKDGDFAANLALAGGFKTVIDKFTTKAKDDKFVNHAILISMSSSIFNVLPITSELRFVFLQNIVNMCMITSNYKMLLNLSNDIYSQWLKPIQTDRQIAEFYLYLIGTLNETTTNNNNDNKTIIKDDKTDISNKVLSLYEYLVSEYEPVLEEQELNSFLTMALNNENKLELSNYTTLYKFDKMSSNFKELLFFYIAKDLTSFETFYNTNASTDFQQIDYKILKQKLLIIKLIVVCYGKSQVSYAELTQSIGLQSTTDLENLIIHCIKKNFIQGKLNQFKQVFEINHVIYLGDFNLDNWKLVSVKLNNWKKSLKEIKENVDSNTRK